MSKLAHAIVLGLVVHLGINNADGQVPPSPPPQIYWLQSPHQAAQLAGQFRMPILVHVTSEHCRYCRKMERETWSNLQIITMVEEGFIPLELTAERNREMIAAMGIRAFPTTLLFTPDARFVGGTPGYLTSIQVAGLMKNAQRPEVAARHVDVNQ